MRQPFYQWLVIWVFLGLAACGGTVPSGPASISGESTDEAAAPRANRQLNRWPASAGWAEELAGGAA